MKRQLQFLVVSIGLYSQVFVSCQKHREEVQPSPPQEEVKPLIPKADSLQPVATVPGYFVVSSTSRASSPSGRTTQTTAAEFDLGSIRASKEFLFMIANGGDEAIFNVSLTSDVAAFEVTPRSIQYLPGKGASGIIPLVSVGVIHGRQLNGTGDAPILPKGRNAANIKLTGKTLNEKKDTIEVAAEFTATVEAKVVDVKFLSGDQEIFFTKDKDYIQYYADPAKPAYMVNTGNVTIHPTITYYPYPIGNQVAWKEVISTFALQPGEKKEITNLIAYVGERMENNVTYACFSNSLVSFQDEGTIVANKGSQVSGNQIKFQLVNNQQ